MKNYVFIGDSLTFGYGVNKSSNWLYLLTPFLDGTVYNKGVNGNTSTDMLNRFTEDVIENKPSTVFIMCGTNDLLSAHSCDSIIDNLKLMIKETLDNNIKPIIGIPPTIIPSLAYELFYPTDTYQYCYENLNQLKLMLIDLCISNKVNYIDFHQLTSNNINNDIFLDGIHLNSPGNKLLFEEIKKYLYFF